MNRKIKVGVIGVGALGRHHTRLYHECADAELVGIFDSDQENAAKAAAEFATTAFPSMAELAAACEALSVAVPTHLHHEVVKNLLLQKRHVLVEKPLAATIAEAEDLVRTASACNCLLQVGHVERFSPVLDCLEQVPGTPLFLDAVRVAPYPPPRPGLHPRGTEVSVILDLMIHDIDIVLDLVKSPVSNVSAVGARVLSDSLDIANARLEFANGAVANLTASRISPDRIRALRVFKEQAYFSLDLHSQKAELARAGDGQIERQSLPVPERNALLAELQDFCSCLKARRNGDLQAQPKVPGTAGLLAMQVAEQITTAIGGK